MEAIERAEAGLIDAELGGGVIKQRIARPGAGRSAGFRTVIAFRSHDRAVYVFGFSKSERANVSARELTALKLFAADFLESDEASLNDAVEDGRLIEIKRNTG